MVALALRELGFYGEQRVGVPPRLGRLSRARPTALGLVSVEARDVDRQRPRELVLYNLAPQDFRRRARRREARHEVLLGLLGF